MNPDEFGHPYRQSRTLYRRWRKGILFLHATLPCCLRAAPRSLAMVPMFLTIAVLAQDSYWSRAPIGVPEVRYAVEKSLPFLEKEGLAWETKNCVSCHHGPWM